MLPLGEPHREPNWIALAAHFEQQVTLTMTYHNPHVKFNKNVCFHLGLCAQMKKQKNVIEK
jgi:hypothetical protein